MEGLPLELIVAISQHLPEKAYCRFRQTYWIYYQLLDDVIIKPLNSAQRSYYYQLLDWWEQHPLALDLSALGSGRLTVAISLAKRLNRSITYLGMPSKHMEILQVTYHNGIKDIFMPIIPRIALDRAINQDGDQSRIKAVSMPPVPGMARSRAMWRQRLKQKDLIIWEHKETLGFFSTRPFICALINEALEANCPVMTWLNPSHHGNCLPAVLDEINTKLSLKLPYLESMLFRIDSPTNSLTST